MYDVDNSSPAKYFAASMEYMRKQTPFCWHILSQIAATNGDMKNEENPKLLRAISAWGHLMRIKSKRYQGVHLNVGLSMYSVGCSKQFFELAVKQGISCSMTTVNAFLKSTTSPLTTVGFL